MMKDDSLKLDFSIYRELKDHIDEIEVLGKLLDYEVEIDDGLANILYTEQEDGNYDKSIRSYACFIYDKKFQEYVYRINLIYSDNRILKYYVGVTIRIRLNKKWAGNVFVHRNLIRTPIRNKVELDENEFKDLYLGLQKIKESL